MSYFRANGKTTSQPGAMGRCSRPDTATAIQPHYKQLIGNLGAQALPIVYSDVYNIGFLGVRLPTLSHCSVCDAKASSKR